MSQIDTAAASLQATRDELADMLKQTVGEAETLLKGASSAASHEYASLLKRAEEKLRRAKDELQRLEETALLNAKHAARATDRAVHEHPYAAMGAAAAVGVLLGLLIARR
ncbi:MAG: DUF883 domain-containing protein [Pseudomonadota bacterium]|jgi:ElaB/YqjD/DUF883 family membrane-anchored ribosome-binding protein|nr:DUF883 domain-containing protein [Pseudomonadota bacterium]